MQTPSEKKGLFATLLKREKDIFMYISILVALVGVVSFNVIVLAVLLLAAIWIAVFFHAFVLDRSPRIERLVEIKEMKTFNIPSGGYGISFPKERKKKAQPKEPKNEIPDEVSVPEEIPAEPIESDVHEENDLDNQGQEEGS